MLQKQQPARKVLWRGSVTSRDEARPLLHEPGDLVLVERGCPRSMIIKCPCGCGDEIVLNLDRRTGRAWRIYRDHRGLTLFPSVWRDSGCKSHFILWHDDILMCNRRWEDDTADAELESGVLQKLAADRWQSFDEIAQSLEIIPWSVLFACRRLVRRGLAREGSGQLQGCFQRSPR